MEYTNGFAKEAFLQHMFEEFPSVFDNTFAREMLENIVDYGTADNFTHTKNDLFYFLMDMIPEIGARDLVPFMDKTMLTNEILAQVEPAQDKGERMKGKGNVQSNSTELDCDLNGRSGAALGERNALREWYTFEQCGSLWKLTFVGENVWTLDDSAGMVAAYLKNGNATTLKEYVDICIEGVKLALAESSVFVFEEFHDRDFEVMREKMVEAWGGVFWD